MAPIGFLLRCTLLKGKVSTSGFFHSQPRSRRSALRRPHGLSRKPLPISLHQAARRAMWRFALLLIQKDDETEFRRGDFRRHVDANLPGLHNVFPAWSQAIDRKVEAFDAGRDLRGGSGYVIECKARQRSLDQFGDESRRADLGQPGDIRNQIRFADRRLNLENPAAWANAALISNCAGKKERLHLPKRNADGF